MVSITLPLALAQTIIWASIFYLFPALLPIWESETDWSKAQLTGAFTIALISAAIVSPMAGRLIDAGWGRSLMLGGTLCATVCLVALSQVAMLWQFYGVWFGLGLCMAACLYEPCFANLVRHLKGNAKPTITRITLMAGLAGTVAFPTAHGLATLFNWRETVLFFAAGTALITLPLTAYALTCLQRQYRVNAPPKTRKKIKVEMNRKFALLAAAFMIVAIVHGMIITHLLPMLAERGVVPALAILTASLVGPMQVVGRLLMIATEGRTTTFTTAFACYFGMATGTAMLLLAGANQVMILSFVVLHGAAYGVTSIFRPILTREVLGETNFGLISGRIGGLFMLGTAIAPFGGAMIWQFAGYPTMLALGVGLLLSGAFMLRAAIRLP